MAQLICASNAPGWFKLAKIPNSLWPRLKLDIKCPRCEWEMEVEDQTEQIVDTDNIFCEAFVGS